MVFTLEHSMWVTGFLCVKGLPRMVTSGVVFIVAGATCRRFLL
jgi:hypothetical protein